MTDGHTTCRYDSIPYFLQISQFTRRATFYSLWARFLHLLIAYPKVLVDSSQNLHSAGVSEVLSMLCLIEFVLKACSWTVRIKSSVSFYEKPILSHLHLLFVAQTTHVGISPLSSWFSFPASIFGNPGDSLHLTPSWKQVKASILLSLWESHARTYFPFLHTPQYG